MGRATLGAIEVSGILPVDDMSYSTLCSSGSSYLLSLKPKAEREQGSMIKHLQCEKMDLDLLPCATTYSGAV